MTESIKSDIVKYLDSLALNTEEINEEIIEEPTLNVSDEQLAIINAILDKKHVKVDAVAGSGKTTLVLELAKRTDMQIIQITYNAALKDEVRAKVQAKMLSNIEVHSYHSLAVKYYSSTAYSDQKIDDIIKENTPIKKLRNFDILVIDETQDMMFLYFKLVKKFIMNTHTSPILLILGDRQQSVYDFKGADKRFLTMCDKIFDLPFVELQLNTSYRLTTELANFISPIANRQINTTKNGPLVEYIFGDGNYIVTEKSKHKMLYDPNTHYINGIVLQRILKLLESELKPQDIFILMPSTKKDTHISRELEHILVEKGIPCYISLSDASQKTFDAVVKNKVIFTTLNQCKGRERKAVFIYHFDNSYFNYYAKDHDIAYCPNTHYVGTTRASKYLFVIHSSTYSVLPYIEFPIIEDKVIFSKNKPTDFRKIKSSVPNLIEKSVTDFIMFIKDKYLSDIGELLDYSTIPPINTIEIPIIAEFGDNTEELSVIIGIATAAAWEYKLCGKCEILEYVKQSILNRDKDKHDKCDDTFMKINNLRDIIIIANKYFAIRANVDFKFAQITNYDWFTDTILNDCIANYNKCVKTCTKFEQSLNLTIICNVDKVNQIVTNTGNSKFIVELNGSIDGIDYQKENHTVWEFKCVNELTNEHLLQLIVYAFMYENQFYIDDDNIKIKRNSSLVNYKSRVTVDISNSESRITNTVYKLFNCKTGEIHILNYDHQQIVLIIKMLLENVIFNVNNGSDEEFVKKCISYEVSDFVDPYLKTTLKELKEMCKQRGLTKYSTKTRKELIAMLTNPIEIIEDTLESKNLSDLRELCKTRGIKGYSKLNKSDLLKLLT